MSIQKTKSQAGNIIYKLPPNKERKLHDDRAYCLAMLGYFLSERRKEDMAKSDKPTQDFSSYLKSLGRNPGRVTQNENPFNGLKNPFVQK